MIKHCQEDPSASAKERGPCVAFGGETVLVRARVQLSVLACACVCVCERVRASGYSVTRLPKGEERALEEGAFARSAAVPAPSPTPPPHSHAHLLESDGGGGRVWVVEEERWMWKRRLRRQEQRQGGAGVDQQVAKLSRDQYARPSLRPHPLPSLPLHLSPPEEAPSCSSSSSSPTPLSLSPPARPAHRTPTRLR